MAAHRIRHQLEAAVAAAALVQVMHQQSKRPPPMTISEIVDHIGSRASASVCANDHKLVDNGHTQFYKILNFTLFTKPENKIETTLRQQQQKCQSKVIQSITLWNVKTNKKKRKQESIQENSRNSIKLNDIICIHIYSLPYIVLSVDVCRL